MRARLFPRYETEGIDIGFTAFSSDSFFELDTKPNDIRIVNISFSGIKIESVEKFEFQKYNLLRLHFEGKNYELKSEVVWAAEDLESKYPYKTGFTLKLGHQKLYRNWLIFIKKLHVKNIESNFTMSRPIY